MGSDGVATAVAIGTATIRVEHDGARGEGSIAVREGAAPTTRWREVSIGDRTACGITTSGNAYCWGEDYWGQIPDGVRRQWTLTHSPAPISEPEPFRAIAVGDWFGCGIGETTELYCWGWARVVNRNASPGEHLLSPKAVNGPSFTALSSGLDHVCGLDASGGAHCWGLSAHGEIGNGVTGISGAATPQPVQTDLSFSSIFAGQHKTCAIATDARPFCWGSGFGGSLGTGSEQSAAVPVAVAGDLHVAALTGSFHSCALTELSELYCWGPNNWLNMGASGEDALTPQLLQHPQSYETVEAGRMHTCALTAAGEAYCWGSNRYGNLGGGTDAAGSECGPAGYPCTAEPVRVVGDVTFDRLSVGASSTCGITRTGELYCWGSNEGGQLGIGSAVPHVNRPTRVVDPVGG